MEGDAVFGFYGLDNFGFQAYDFFRGGLPAGIHNDQRLILINLGAAKAFSLEAALLYHPRRRDLDLVPNLKVRHLVVRTVVLTGYLLDAFKVLTAYDRIAEETSGRSSHCRIRQLCVADVDDGLTDNLRSKGCRDTVSNRRFATPPTGFASGPLPFTRHGRLRRPKGTGYA